MFVFIVNCWWIATGGFGKTGWESCLSNRIGRQAGREKERKRWRERGKERKEGKARKRKN